MQQPCFLLKKRYLSAYGRTHSNQTLCSYKKGDFISDERIEKGVWNIAGFFGIYLKRIIKQRKL
jgi:hypothetical protein